jgi:uncharacterized lipoprotein YajG
MIPPFCQAVNWFAAALLLVFAGCQQQANNAPTSDSVSKQSDDSATLREVTLEVTGMG